MKERVIGVLLLVAGAVVGYFCIYEPLQLARSGAASVSTSAKGAILAPLFLIGLLYLVLGSGTTAIMGTREKPKPFAYVIGIGLALVGLGLYLWLRSQLESYGYDFHGRF